MREKRNPFWVFCRRTNRFVNFVFGPLFVKGRWLVWIFLFLLLMMMGNAVTAIRMEIPNLQQVNRIKGNFKNFGSGYGKGVLFDIGIVDERGVVHRCNCEPLGYSNCLDLKTFDHTDILNNLDSKMLERYTLQKVILKWLDGKSGEVWMYPNRSIFGTKNSCYKIMSDAYIFLSFEQSIRNYERAKGSVGVYCFWVMMIFGLFAIFVFVVVRVIEFFKEMQRGQFRG